MLIAALALAGFSWVAEARELAGLKLEEAGEVPVVAQRDVERKSPDFSFFSNRTQELVVLRDTPELRRRAQDEAGSFAKPLPIRSLAGRPVLVYFWASETMGGRPLCKACPAAMVLMQEMHDEFALSGLQVVGLAVAATEADLERAADRYAHRTGAYRGDAAGQLGLNKMPSWALLDEKTNVLAASDTALDRDYLVGKIKQALKK